MTLKIAFAEMYINDVKSGITVVNTEPVILSETVSVAHVDGNNLLGTVVGEFCMNLAIGKAKKTGISFVSAKGESLSSFLSLKPFFKKKLRTV